MRTTRTIGAEVRADEMMRTIGAEVRADESRPPLTRTIGAEVRADEIPQLAMTIVGHTTGATMTEAVATEDEVRFQLRLDDGR
jgi:hypothetical protein